MADRPPTITRSASAPPEDASPGVTRRRALRVGRAAGHASASARRLGVAAVLGFVLFAAAPPATAFGPVRLAQAAAFGAVPLAQAAAPSGGSLESAASRAGDTGRKIGLSLIGLALSVAAVILVFKRDFKEAVGVIAIGIVAVLLVSPAGINVLQDTVSLLFGSS